MNWKIIKENLLKNQYPEPLLDALHKNFINKMQDQNSLTEKSPVTTVPKKELFIVLPFHGSKLSTKLHKSLKSLIANAYPQVDVKIIFRTTCHVSSLFKIKDPIPLRLKSLGLVYFTMRDSTICDARCA